MPRVPGHTSPVRRLHTMPNGGTCAHPDPDTCTAWEHLEYEVACQCGWTYRSKIRAVVDEQRRTHLVRTSGEVPA